MKINKVSYLDYDGCLTSKKSNTKVKKDGVSVPVFKSKSEESALQISLDIMGKYGTITMITDNAFVAKCILKISNVFSTLCGKSVLPRFADYKPMPKGIYGTYANASDTVTFNSNNKRFESENKLKWKNLLGYGFLFPNDFSSLHPAHIFAHEYSHGAHWKHLLNRHGQNHAQRLWQRFEGVTVPTAVGKLITRYKLGNYAIDGKDMCEFMAERMSQDICKCLTQKDWTIKKRPDIKYEDIFHRKWNYRYTSPQSYLDYYTQQVWNGDIEGAKDAVRRIEEFLAREQAQKQKNKTKVLNPIRDAIHNMAYNTKTKLNRHKEPLAHIETRTDVHPITTSVIHKIDNIAQETNISTQKTKSETVEEVKDVIRLGNEAVTHKLNERNDLDLDLMPL